MGLLVTLKAEMYQTQKYIIFLDTSDLNAHDQYIKLMPFFASLTFQPTKRTFNLWFQSQALIWRKKTVG